jgi:predicted metal-dependent hydrolase
VYKGGRQKKMFGSMTQDSAKSRVKEQIDKNLKRVYEDVLNEEVPDRFKDLLAQLRQKDQKAEKS